MDGDARIEKFMSALTRPWLLNGKRLSASSRDGAPATCAAAAAPHRNRVASICSVWL